MAQATKRSKMESTWNNSTTSRSSTKRRRASKKARCINCLRTRVVFRHGCCQPCWRGMSLKARDLVREARTMDASADDRLEADLKKINVSTWKFVPFKPLDIPKRRWWEFWKR